MGLVRQIVSNCNNCFKGKMIVLPEEILDDGTVVHRAKCDKCGQEERLISEPYRSTRITDVKKCGKCGYEYFFVSIDHPDLDIFDEMELYHGCPNCLVKGYQMRLTENYGELKHKHGKYGIHPVSRKHRE